MPDPKEPAPDPQPDKPADPPAKPPKSPPQPDPTRPSEEEIEARVKQAREDERNRIAAEEAKKARKKEEDDAKQRGEWQKLHDAEKAARETAEKDKAAAILSEQVSDALADVAADYEGYSVKVLKTYVKPLVLAALAAADAPDAAAIAKATKAAVDQYVKDNPRQQPKGAGGAPYQPPHGQRLPKEEKPNGKARSEVALRYF